MNEKTRNYYGTYMRVLQENPKKPAAIMETICGYCNEWRMSTIICALYVGIARNAKCQRLLWDSYAGIAMNEKGHCLLWDLYAGITFNAKCLWLFFEVICRYCILENGLMESIIENDVRIICLKCVDYLKSLQVMWILLT